MPLPTLFLLAFPLGLGVALAATAELRAHLRSVWSSTSFAAAVPFGAFVLLPVSVYFYVFHGDWAVHYLFDTSLVPSAIALFAFVAQLLLYVLGFGMGAWLVRTQRNRLAVLACVMTSAIALLPLWFARTRLDRVANYAQFRGEFGVLPWSASMLPYAGIALGLLLAVGYVVLLGRLLLPQRSRRASR